MKTLILILFSGLVMLPQLSNGQLIDLNGRWKFAIGDQSSWSKKDYDDSDWETIRVPSAWEDRGFHGYDGFAWYRTTFNGQYLKEGDKLYVNLGYIDDADEVYLNGELIGFSGSMPPNFKTAFNSERIYVIPKYLVNYNGANTLAVRVFDVTQGGGIIDGDIGIYELVTGSPLLLDLQGIWDFSYTRSGSKPDPDEDWDQILVPGYWEKQGYWKRDGYGWYRKSFDLTSEMYNEELILMLGKIDDFDEVYINGKLAGRTRDNGGVGWSKSYQKLRAYYIPKVLLKPNQPNLIEVLVEDIGVDGGIYEGPIGITTRSLFEKHFRNK